MADRIRAVREALDLSPAEMCRRALIAPNTYSMIESGKNIPSIETGLRLYDTLGVTFDWIYRGDPSGLPARIAIKINRVA